MFENNIALLSCGTYSNGLLYVFRGFEKEDQTFFGNM
jgi:hypothetical protein